MSSCFSKINRIKVDTKVIAVEILFNIFLLEITRFFRSEGTHT